MKPPKITLLLFLASTALHAQEAELAQKPANGPEWGLRFGLTFLFPK